MDNVKQTKKELKFKNTNYVWNTYHFNAKNRVGDCSKIAQGFIEQIGHGKISNTLEDFENYYFEHFNYHIFVDTSKAFKRKLESAGMKITYNEAYYYTWIRVIYDTYNGIVQQEYSIQLMFLDASYTVRHTTPTEDRYYSIDMEVSKDGKTYAIQIKPISYYYGILNDKEIIVKAFKRDIEHNEEYLKKFPKNKIIYLFYDKDDVELYSFNDIKKLSRK